MLHLKGYLLQKSPIPPINHKKQIGLFFYSISNVVVTKKKLFFFGGENNKDSQR